MTHIYETLNKLASFEMQFLYLNSLNDKSKRKRNEKYIFNFKRVSNIIFSPEYFELLNGCVGNNKMFLMRKIVYFRCMKRKYDLIFCVIQFYSHIIYFNLSYFYIAQLFVQRAK